MNSKFIIALSAVAVAGGVLAASTEGGNRPRGFKFLGDKLTLLPYVNLAYTFDTNIDQVHKNVHDSIFLVTPGAELKYDNKDGFVVDAKVFYTHKWYCKYSSLNQDSYGEGLHIEKNTSKKGEKGWSFVFRENYAKFGQNDDMTKSDGRGIWRDREQINVTGAIQRRFGDRFHATVNGAYDWLDYDNDKKKYGKLYGWTRYSAGLEFGYGLTELTDLLVAGSYQKYTHSKGYNGISNTSQGWTIMGGIGSRLDRQITYRALLGASWFEYGRDYTDHGWTYQLSANWKATDRLNIVLLGSSYYQPSESVACSATKVYSLSAGAKYRFTDRFSGSADVAYRKDDRVYTNRDFSKYNRNEDYVLGRLRGDWYFNRYTSLYAALEYEWVDYAGSTYLSYNRFRGTVGLQLHW